jgi:hypothetical protein
LSTVQLPLVEYPYDSATLEEVFHTMVGDFQRLKVYATNGFQAPVEIPRDIWHVYEELVRRGYTAHLLNQ